VPTSKPTLAPTAPACKDLLKSDVVLAVDSSASITSTQWSQFQHFIDQIISDFPISQHGMNVAALQFATRAHKYSDLEGNKTRALNARHSMAPRGEPAGAGPTGKMGEMTNMHYAVEEAMKIQGRSGVIDTLLVLTDGLPSGGTAPPGTLADIAFRKAKAQGIKVLFLLIGQLFRWIPLPSEWMSAPAVVIDSFGGLKDARQAVVDMVCNAAVTTSSPKVQETVITASPQTPPVIIPPPEPTPPTAEPVTLQPTEEPTVEATQRPSQEPSQEPTSQPTRTPTEVPTTLPPTSDEPSLAPTHTPTEHPTSLPTTTPTTYAPTFYKPKPGETPQYGKKYTKKWPHCKNVKCMSGTKCQMEAACNAAAECTGFSFTVNAAVGNGCLKACGAAEFGGYGKDSHDYWAKGKYAVCKAAITAAQHAATRPAGKNEEVVGSFMCNKAKRFVPGAPYSQWSSFTKSGGEVARALCRKHWTAAQKPYGWWFQYYSNGHFNCAKFSKAVTTTSSTWQNTHGRPEEVCIPFAEEEQLEEVQETAETKATWGRRRRRRSFSFSFYTRRRRTPAPTKMTYPPIAAMQSCGKVDLALVIDASGSVSAQQWVQQMSFAQALVKNMGISSDSVNVGIVLFARNVLTKVGLSSNAAALLPHLVHRSGMNTGATNMVGALAHANAMLKRGRSGVPKVVMMLTDGQPNYGGNPDGNFATMKKAGTSVMMVLIGPGITAARARNWGTVAPISISSFTALSSAFTTISTQFCKVAKEAVVRQQASWKPCGKVDVALVIDASGSVRDDQWQQQMKFSKDLVESMGISSTGVNAGIVFFARNVQTKIGLTSNAASLVPHLNSRYGMSTSATNMVGALAHADAMLQQGRPGVPKMVVFLTDGQPSTGGNPDRNFQAMKNKGTAVMMVLIGPGITTARAKNWGTTAPIAITSFSALQAAVGQIRKSFESACKTVVSKPKVPTSCECKLGTVVTPTTPVTLPVPPPATKPPRITKYTYAYGGNGGSSINSYCPDGHYINWWKIRTGSLVDRIQGRCSNGAWLRACGGYGGGESQRAGVWGTHKMYVRTGALVDQFNGRGGNGGGSHWLDCGSGFKVTGYQLRCGSLVDKVRFQCKNV
jgi:Mg-chelatase subunit ChlD